MAAPTASDATRASDFTSAVLAHTYRNYAAHLPRILPWLGLWFGLHALIEFVVPAVWPRAFDALGRDGKLATARERNRDARTKVIAIVQALFVSSLPALWGRFVSGEYARLKSDMFAASPLTMALAEANVAYFTWDIFVCWYDRLTLEWHVHAWLAFLAFTLALHPFAQYMAMVALVFEVSTPFLHVRKLLIQMGRGAGRAFAAVQLCFVATFVWSRIVFGFAEAYDFQRQLLALVRSGAAHSDAVALLYMVVIAGGHYALSVMWMYYIVVAALRPARSAGRHRGAGSARVKSV